MDLRNGTGLGSGIGISSSVRWVASVVHFVVGHGRSCFLDASVDDDSKALTTALSCINSRTKMMYKTNQNIILVQCICSIQSRFPVNGY